MTMKDGRVANQEVIQKASGSSATIAEVEEVAITTEEILDNEADDEPALNPATKGSGKLVVEEEVQVGHVSWAASKFLSPCLFSSNCCFPFSKALCDRNGREIPCAVLCGLDRKHRAFAADGGIPDMVSGLLGFAV